MLKSFVRTIVLITLFVGCGNAEPMATPIPPSSTASPTATATSVPSTPTATSPTTPTQEPSAISQGFLLDSVGFSTPESALYDPEADVYLVTNTHGDPPAKDGTADEAIERRERQKVAYPAP